MNQTRNRVFLVVGLLAIAVMVYLAKDRPKPLPQHSTTSFATIAPARFHEVKRQVDVFCGDCHATPLPDSFPRDAWFQEVNRGYDFYYQSGRNDLEMPVKKDVYTFYRSQAPERLEIPKPDRSNRGSLRFRKERLPIPNISGSKMAPAVSHLSWRTPNEVPALMDPTLMVSDMRLNHCQEVLFKGYEPYLGGSLNVPHVAHTEFTDLDQNGRIDLIVSDLGSFLPEEHNRGRVLWVRKNANGTFAEPIEIATGLGRVADARVGDFDGDEDLDVVVAEFGLIETGRIVLLRNETENWGSPLFELQIVDPRHGAIHVPVVDLNRDGLLDFVALISQEHETVEAFLNDGQGGFVNQLIFQADDPSYGSSGIELTDMDNDGDMDIIYTNGDMYDSFYVKPYHAVHWLENRADSTWQDHLLVNMPGVFRALPGDLDGDGDKDIVAVALVPDNVLQSLGELDLDSVAWLEQTEPNEFVYHTLEANQTYHVALEVADFNRDGHVDFAVGNFREGLESSVTVWWNRSDDGSVVE